MVVFFELEYPGAYWEYGDRPWLRAGTNGRVDWWSSNKEYCLHEVLLQRDSCCHRFSKSEAAKILT